jgi:uncharacterized protein YtpQ (UPF0354 family)
VAGEKGGGAAVSETTNNQIEIEIKQIKLALQRPVLARDAVSLLAIKLIELISFDRNVKAVSDEAVEVTEHDGKKITIYLTNLLAEAEKNPSERLEIVERYIRVLTSEPENELPSRENIVSTVRHSDYLTFLKQEERDLVTEHLIGELWTVWAVDYPESIQLITAKQISSLMITREDLKVLGLVNVRRLLSDLECESYDTFFVLKSINSVYLSSSLLMDEVWDFAATLVDGDLVVAAPARDTVIFSGTQNAAGLRALRNQASYVVKNGNHVLSETLFQRVDGRWVPFT